MLHPRLPLPTTMKAQINLQQGKISCHQPVFRSSRIRVAVADAQTQQQTDTTFGWGSSSAQGPRPTMEDELRLEIDASAGFTYAGGMLYQLLKHKAQAR